MGDNRTLRDKLSEARVQPSGGVWTKIEAGLEKEDRMHSLKRWSVMGWAAAVFVLVAVYITGQYSGRHPAYAPQTLELNDQAGDFHIPVDYYPDQRPAMKFRADGRLVPNAQTLWEHPLMPAGKKL